MVRTTTQFLFSFFLILTTLLINADTVYIVIHGTWGSEMAWYMPGGDFFDALECSAHKHNAAVVPFCWSGKNSPNARNKAAESLAKLIEAYDTKTEIIIVAHSHGGTVALLACCLLKKNHIAIVYTLGMPINRFLYPNMNTIDYCYNLFSFEDLIQPVFGMFAREHAPHERIANVRVIIDGKEPDHSQLHDKIVGKWLPNIHTLMKNSSVKTTEPGIIYFDNTKAPVYIFDAKRKEALERDHQLSLLMLNSLRNSFEIGSKIPLTNR